MYSNATSGYFVVVFPPLSYIKSASSRASIVRLRQGFPNERNTPNPQCFQAMGGLRRGDRLRSEVFFWMVSWSDQNLLKLNLGLGFIGVYSLSLASLWVFPAYFMCHFFRFTLGNIVYFGGPKIADRLWILQVICWEDTSACGPQIVSTLYIPKKDPWSISFLRKSLFAMHFSHHFCVWGLPLWFGDLSCTFHCSMVKDIQISS